MFLWMYQHYALTVVGLIVMLGMAAVACFVLVCAPMRTSRLRVAISAATLVGSLAAAVLVADGVSGAGTRQVSDAIRAKYGSQVTQVGDFSWGTETQTSSWVIDGVRKPCTLDLTDRENPIVTCGEELPLHTTN